VFGTDHDTAAFAVESIRRWRRTMGEALYPAATRLLLTADCGGSNGYRVRLWKRELQKLADETGLEIAVCHFPPGTSKWNKIEHRLFSAISQNWRGKPLTSHEVMVNLIAATTTRTGLKVQSALDTNAYASGVTVATPRWRLSTSARTPSTASGTTRSYPGSRSQQGRLFRDGPLRGLGNERRPRGSTSAGRAVSGAHGTSSDVPRPASTWHTRAPRTWPASIASSGTTARSTVESSSMRRGWTRCARCRRPRAGALGQLLARGYAPSLEPLERAAGPLRSRRRGFGFLSDLWRLPRLGLGIATLTQP